MAVNMRTTAVVASMAVAAYLLASTAFAQPGDNGTRPGWGGTNPKSQGNSVGDQNHVHTGPPGQTVRPPQ